MEDNCRFRIRARFGEASGREVNTQTTANTEPTIAAAAATVVTGAKTNVIHVIVPAPQLYQLLTCVTIIEIRVCTTYTVE